jgi:hypothetical protein
MVTRGFASSLAAAALAGAFASAQQSTPQPAFRFERPVSPSSGGPQRLAIDVPLLVGGNPFAVQCAASTARPAR